MRLIPQNTPPDRIQSRLLLLAGLVLILSALALTLAPAVRARTWAVSYSWSHWLAILLWGVIFTASNLQASRSLPDRDPFLLPIVALLSGLGLLTIWRLTPSFGLRQSAWLLVAGVVLILLLRFPFDLSILRRYKYLWLTGGLALTALTLIFGTNPQGFGPPLWLGCCGVYLQPSEPLKLLLVVYLAAYLADRQFLLALPVGRGRSTVLAHLLPLLAPTLLMTGLALSLLLVQRDLGTAAIFLFIYAVLIYLGSSQLIIPLTSLLVLGLAGLSGYFLFDVVRLRIDAWLNPWIDPSGRSFQIVQSLMAVANGGILGRGLGLGSPGLVPVAHSDFAFTAFAEENGLAGALVLLILLALLANRGLRLALRATDAFQRCLAAGLTVYLVGQSVLIIGGNLRLLPLTGVPLPFFSYGGTSLLTSTLAIVILLKISNVPPETSPVRWQPARPYLQVGSLLLAGLAGCALVAGWWAVVRAPVLLARTDNARRSISDRYVLRGAVLDRNNVLLNQSQGQPGEYTRVYLYPPLSSIIGYTHPVYGQSGLEASYDSYLRGLQGNPGLLIWWNQLLYGQPPPGLDLRLSLDANLQLTADGLLAGRTGALVLLNASNGEILALASHPAFDANRLDQDWDLLIQNVAAPLLNRTTQALYSPGPVLGPLLFAAAGALETLPELPASPAVPATDSVLRCALLSGSAQASTWSSQLIAGCPQAVASLAQALGPAQLLNLFVELGFYSLPQIGLPANSVSAPSNFSDAGQAALGLEGDLRLSPLQMALAVAALTNQGTRPGLRLVLGVHTTQAGWVVLPVNAEPRAVLASNAAWSATTSLAQANLPIWQSLALAPGGQSQTFTWYIGGTVPSWQGAPLAMALLLEEENPFLASEIGQALFQTALNQDYNP